MMIVPSAEGITDRLGFVGKPYGRPFVAAGLKGGCKASTSVRRAVDRKTSHSRRT